MKKFISILLVCCILTGTFAACGKTKETGSNGTDSSTTTNEQQTAEADTTKDNSTDGANNAEIVDGRFVETKLPLYLFHAGPKLNS